MKITKRQLKRIIKEEKKLLEYERHVDKDGNIYDDEGNVDRRGSSFGSRYGGETYTGTSAPWDRKKRPTSIAPNSVMGKQKTAVEGHLAVKHNNFLQSILDQMNAGRRISDKQKAVMKKILVKHDPTTADLFEGIKITKRQLRRIIREESKGSTKKYDDDSALHGDQDELPDALQKGIIDKVVTDREEETNESFRIIKRRLRRIIEGN